MINIMRFTNILLALLRIFLSVTSLGNVCREVCFCIHLSDQEAKTKESNILRFIFVIVDIRLSPMNIADIYSCNSIPVLRVDYPSKYAYSHLLPFV